MKKFGLLGAAGYVAPKHMKAIKETGNVLCAALDPFDSVGIIDSYFPESSFFIETERFERHIDKMRRSGAGLDYLSICSPNYLHDSHIRLGLRNDCHVICEKPLIINPKNIKYLKLLEDESGKKINTILQLRHHQSVIDLKREISNQKKYDIELTYITSRGKWYDHSWKSDITKSGGLSMNIGIHFFDMLMWVFGAPIKNTVFIKQDRTIFGFLELERANIKWLLSIDGSLLKKNNISKKMYRSMKIGEKEFEFTHGFEDLHTKSYEEIIKGNGCGLEELLNSLQVASEINLSKIDLVPTDLEHPFLRHLND